MKTKQIVISGTCLLIAWILTLSIILGNVIQVQAEDAASVVFQSNLGGSARYGIISESTMYGVMGSRLYVIDVSNIANPVQMGSVRLPGIARRISMQGDVLYIACTEGGMVAVDVSDPQNPQQLSAITFDTEENICKTFDVVVKDNYAYVADHTGFHVVDVSNPSSPVRKASFTDFDNDRHLAYDVNLDGNLAFLCCEGDGLYIFDITNPLSPQKISNWKNPEEDMSQFYQSVRDGNYLYIAGGIAGIVILDISDLNNPAFVSNLVEDNYGGIIGVVKIDDYCYLQDEFFNLHVIDVSDPSTPVNVSNYDLGGNHSLGIWNDGNRMVLANSTYGIRIFDVSGTDITQRGAFLSPGRIMDCEGGGGYAYIAAGQNGLYVYDVTNPERLILTANIQLEGYANGLFVEDGTVFVAELPEAGEGTEGGLLEIVDAQTPSNPTILSSVNLAGEPYDVFVKGGIAYVSLQTKGMAIVDVSDTSNPEVLSTYDTSGICYDVAPWGSFIIGADGLNGMTILDVRDETYPKKIADGFDIGNIQNVAVWDTYVLLSGGADGLAIADVSLPCNPSVVQTIEPLTLRHDKGQIKVSTSFSSYLLLAETIGIGQIRLFDLRDPSNPIELAGDNYLVGDPVNMNYSPDQHLVYVSSQIAGLYIYKVTVPDEPQINLDGRWIGSGASNGSEVGIAIELDQVRRTLEGTLDVYDASIMQGTVNATIAGNDTITGSVAFNNGTATIDLTYDAGTGEITGDVSGAMNVSDLKMVSAGMRGMLDFQETVQTLSGAIDTRAAAEESLLEKTLLNVAQSSLNESLEADNFSRSLAYAAIAEGALQIPDLPGPVAAAYSYLYPSAYWEIRIKQAISQNMADGICPDYQKRLSFRHTAGDNALGKGESKAERGNPSGAMCLFSHAARNYEAVSRLYKEYKPECPTYGYAEFDGYYEGVIDFGIVAANLRMCVAQAEDGTVTGDVFISVEASGEFMTGSLADSVNTGDTESVLSGTIEVIVGDITAHILIQGWQYNVATGQWEGQVEVVEQSVKGNASIKFTSEDCPDGWNEI